MKIGELIKHYRTNHKISMGEFAAMTALSKTYISMLEKNINTSTGKPVIPSVSTLQKCASAMGMELDDLINQLDPDQVIKLPDNIVKTYQAKWNEIQSNSLQPTKYHKYKLLGNIACGSPIEAVQEEGSFVETELNIHADYVLKCQGDSMINARIFDGDYVFIKEQPEVENGEIAAVWMDGTVTLKRFYRYDEYIELRAENPMFKPIVIHQEDFDSIRIIGKAVACQFLVE